MEFREILGKRRMHRAFLPDALPTEQIERIVNVIRRAPSGGFSQGGSIVVVTDDAKRAEIALAFGDEHYSRRGRNYIADAPTSRSTTRVTTKPTSSPPPGAPRSRGPFRTGWSTPAH